MKKMNLNLIQAYKVPVRLLGNTSLNVMVTSLGYKKDEIVYVLSDKMIEDLVKANRDIDPKVVKALEYIGKAIEKCKGDL